MKWIKPIALSALVGLSLSIAGCANSPASTPDSPTLLQEFRSSTQDWQQAPPWIQKQLVHHKDGSWTFRGYKVTMQPGDVAPSQ